VLHAYLLGKNINIINKSAEALSDSSKEISLEINAEKTKYILMSRHQNAEQNHNRMMANKSFENVANWEGQ
jgi:hypothetical protein